MADPDSATSTPAEFYNKPSIRVQFADQRPTIGLCFARPPTTGTNERVTYHSILIHHFHLLRSFRKSLSCIHLSETEWGTLLWKGCLLFAHVYLDSPLILMVHLRVVSRRSSHLKILN